MEKLPLPEKEILLNNNLKPQNDALEKRKDYLKRKFFTFPIIYIIIFY